MQTGEYTFNEKYWNTLPVNKNKEQDDQGERFDL